MKPPVCKICKEPFKKYRTGQQVCGFDCALKLSKQKRDRETRKLASLERQERKEAINKLRTMGWYVSEAQKAVNAFIRLRDEGKPCISCGKHKMGYDAGHYLARSTHPELRFNEDNIHAQCYYCNNYNKNSHHAYRENLIERIGIERVLALESTHPPVKWSIDELKAMKDLYKAKLKELK